MSKLMKVIVAIPLFYILVNFYIIAFMIPSFIFGTSFLNESEMYGLMIVSSLISGCLSIFMSILTIIKILFRKIYENGEKEKIPKYLLIIMSIVGLIDLIVIIYFITLQIHNKKDLNYNEINNENYTEQVTYNIDFNNEMRIIDGKKYLWNKHLSNIRENSDTFYKIEVSNIYFNNHSNTLIYDVNSIKNEKQIYYNNKLIIKEKLKAENFISIEMFYDYLIIHNILENESTIDLYYILDKEGNLIYNFMDYSSLEENIFNNVLEVIDTKDNSIKFKTYDLFLNGESIEIINIQENVYNCDDYNDNYNIYDIDNEIEVLKYSYCNAY